ncbi:MAG: riboflavin synthase subunit alpha [Candidatus Kerfeldbacteria bacterium]|nr:riboflavin synthase subunit alpha [Candidatus Kerfeldbacteria bacterium]
MFTGIVSGAYPITRTVIQDGLLTFAIDLPAELMDGVEVGASIAIDGVCLTVTRFTTSTVEFDVMQQTLNVTSLANLKVGDMVNVERSHRAGMEIGGHIVSGHVDGTAEVVSVEQPTNNYVITMQMPETWMKYVFPKGFLALNGVSLTVADIDKKNRTITVYLIPETLRRTTFGSKKSGDRINFEVDRQTQVIVDTIVDFLGNLAQHKQLSGDEIQKIQNQLLLPKE